MRKPLFGVSWAVKTKSNWFDTAREFTNVAPPSAIRLAVNKPGIHDPRTLLSRFGLLFAGPSSLIAPFRQAQTYVQSRFL